MGVTPSTVTPGVRRLMVTSSASLRTSTPPVGVLDVAGLSRRTPTAGEVCTRAVLGLDVVFLRGFVDTTVHVDQSLRTNVQFRLTRLTSTEDSGRPS